ncbi:hypothetical protein V1J52_23130 [Streptomyces sp. TRM 70351]|uniref:hypothetical protein n=1 Tax=Streptomyces sp. TRM 70351 TaxID=3116552 RepID=UPI002E7AE5F4|nr:hypothetical protein [Streptomyces sp. TRM 70351]MEE1931037.1 hypothetical protein [Streptomyces sp. TRM 70351]
MPVSDPEAALEGVPHSTWQRLAELASKHRAEEGRPPVGAEEMKSDYIRKAQDYHENPPEELQLRRQTPVQQSNGCYSLGPYELSVVGPVAVGVEGEFCPGQNWSATLTAYLKVAGEIVWKTQYTLSSEHYSITFNPNVGVAKASVTLGIFGSTYCLRISGDACYWWFGWSCRDFNETLHCFG